MANKSFKMTLSEYFYDLLTLDAALSGEATAAHARVLLQLILNSRKDDIEKGLQELANKRGISLEELKAELLGIPNE